MRADASAKQITKRILSRVNRDAQQALAREGFRFDKTSIEQHFCVDHQAETEESYGKQLWYFDGVAINKYDYPVRVFGVVEYSVEYGVIELVENAVFESLEQRERFFAMYQREMVHPSWKKPAHRWLGFGVAVLAVSTLIALLVVHASV